MIFVCTKSSILSMKNDRFWLFDSFCFFAVKGERNNNNTININCMKKNSHLKCF